MNIWQALFLMIPAYLANMIPVVLKSGKLNAPLDFGKKLGRQRILGANKTWKGLIGGTTIATAAMYGLSQLYWPFPFSPALWGFLAGAGALLGDAVESFAKRRLDIKSGQPWIPFDQIDYSLGALTLGSFVVFPGWTNATLVVLISAVAHIVVNHVSFYVGIRDEKW